MNYVRAFLARLEPFIAKDSFVGFDGTFGGDVVDSSKPWAMRDKVQHVFGGAFLWLYLGALPLALGERFVAFLGLGFALEVFELVRYLHWRRKGPMRGEWPGWCDKFSWKDQVANVAGIVAVEVPRLIRTLVGLILDSANPVMWLFGIGLIVFAVALKAYERGKF